MTFLSQTEVEIGRKSSEQMVHSLRNSKKTSKQGNEQNAGLS